MKTIVYVDGYNLYYGRLAGTTYKWLDVAALFQTIVRIQDPRSEVIAIKFFTAHAVARYARHGVKSETAQKQYHRALEIQSQGLLTITLGRHHLTEDELPTYFEGKDPDKTVKTKVWLIVEKKTDVSLAMAMYRDAAKSLCVQTVLCSNDSDAEPALQAIRDDFQGHAIGIVSPVAPSLHGGVNRGLSKIADWTRSSISDQELQASQLPPKVITQKGKIFRKPLYW